MIFAFGDHELDDSLFELRRAGHRVRVQPKVLDLLFLLVRARGKLVLKRELLGHLWAGVTVSEASISRIVLEARRAVDDELQQVIVTVRGRGFRFAATVTEMHGAAPPPTADVPGRVAAADPTFVGRDACVAAMAAKLDDALAGRGGLVWLSGEAGIGKTRTAEELAQRAAARGATVLRAHAPEVPESPPFWLWAQILRAFTRDRGDEETRSVLARVAPLLAGQRVEASVEQFALLDSVTRYLADASREKPLVLVIDDLHWADEPSLRLLEFFSREVRQNAVLVVGTYRDAALVRGPRAHALGGLIAQTQSLSVPLRAFSLEEVAGLVERVSGVRPASEFVRTMHERSGGNPLYVEQLLKTEWADKALTATAHETVSTMDLQQGLIETICRHLEGISPGSREVLSMAAVLGREFELGKLGVVSGLSPEVLLDRLEEAARASMVHQSRTSQHRFAHALVRDVLYRRLSSAERAAAHRQAGEKLLAHYGDALDAHASELADHFARAGNDPERTIELALRAAAHQTQLGHHRAAIKHWHQASGALGMLAREDARRVSVELGLARSQLAAGQEAEARDSFLDAAILARSFSRPEELAEAALGYASLEGAAVAQGRAVLAQALAALDAPAGPNGWRLRAHVEIALGVGEPVKRASTTPTGGGAATVGDALFAGRAPRI
jgi:predicted ATPase/DNA-binding winged helix-turn-helix (wHTH) protein